jgi:hypothetical protein
MLEYLAIFPRVVVPVQVKLVDIYDIQYAQIEVEVEGISSFNIQIRQQK